MLDYLDSEANDSYLDAITWLVVALLALLVGGLILYLLFVSAVNIVMAIAKLYKKVEAKCKGNKVVAEPKLKDSTRIEDEGSPKESNSPRKAPGRSPTNISSTRQLVSTSPNSPIGPRGTFNFTAT